MAQPRFSSSPILFFPRSTTATEDLMSNNALTEDDLSSDAHTTDVSRTSSYLAAGSSFEESLAQAQAASGHFLNAGGAGAAAAGAVGATVGGGGTSYTDAGRAPGDYAYILRYRQGGVVTDVTCNPSPITVPDDGGGDACTAAVNGAGNVELNWAAIPGEDSYQVRDDDGWVATVNNNTSFVDTDPVAGNRSYVIRYRMAGVTTDIPCSPDPVNVP